MTTTVGDMTTFMQCMVDGGQPLLTPETTALSTRPHTHGDQATVSLPDTITGNEAWGEKLPSCWGLGWRVNHDGAEKKFGEAAGSQIFGTVLPRYTIPRVLLLLLLHPPAHAPAPAPSSSVLLRPAPSSSSSSCSVLHPPPPHCTAMRQGLTPDVVHGAGGAFMCVAGHHGAVGTMVWADPVSGLTLCAFTPGVPTHPCHHLPPPHFPPMPRPSRPRRGIRASL